MEALSLLFRSRVFSAGAAVALVRKPKAIALLALALLISAPGAALLASAQAVNLSGLLVSFGSGFNYPQGLAVDANGNVYVADSGNNAVKEILAVGGTIPAYPTTVTLGSGFNSPEGVAVDAGGDVFVADTNNGQVKEIVAVNGTIPMTGAVIRNLGGNVFVAPTGVAVDSHGNVFVADIQLYEILAAGGYTTVNTLAASYDFEPQAVAVDASGNVYDADLDGGIWELLAYKNYTIVKKLAGNLIAPLGVAVDATGDVFYTISGTAAVSEIEAVNGVIPANPTILTINMGSEYSYVGGIASQKNAYLYVSNIGNDTITRLQKESQVYFGKVNVCPAGQTPTAECSNPLTLSYNVTQSGTLGTPRVLTTGDSNLDFTLGSDYTCTGNVTANVTCTVGVTFTPLAPGLRSGAIQIVDGNGHVIATNYLYGIGMGPALGYGPGTSTTVTSGFTKPWGAVADAAGNLYVADVSQGTISEIPAGGSSTVIATGLNSPIQLALDGAGSLYVGSDGPSSSVVIIPPGCAVSSCRQSVGSGFSSAGGVAVDGVGNVFVSDFLAGKVLEVPTGCASGACQITLASGIVNGYSMAVDAAGDLFVAQESSAGIVEIPAGCTTATCRKTVGNGFIGPTGVAVDAAGDVFVSDYPSHNAFEVTASGVRIQIPSPANPLGIAVDSFGDVFLPGQSSQPAGQVKELHRGQLPSFAYPSTPVGSVSTAQYVQLENIGNSTFTTEGPLAISANWEQVAGSGNPTDCPANFSLAPGARCNISVSFDPKTTGPLTGALTLQDNALNGTSVAQSIPLSGTAVASQKTTSNASAAPR